ncbi:hypothetical protein SUDANB130_02454 [Streptomyces sp. enrichment culture]
MGHLNRGVLAARRSRRAVACAARMPAAADASGARGTARSATDCPHPALTGAARLRRSRGAVAPTRAARMPEAADASGARGTARSATDCPHPELTGAARLHTCRPFSGCRRAHPCGTHPQPRTPQGRGELRDRPRTARTRHSRVLPAFAPAVPSGTASRRRPGPPPPTGEAPAVARYGPRATRIFYSAAHAFSVTRPVPRVSCVLYGHGRGPVSGRNVPFAPGRGRQTTTTSASGLETATTDLSYDDGEQPGPRERRRLRRRRAHACWGTTRS